MRFIFAFSSLLLILLAFGCIEETVQETGLLEPVEYVNTLMGTDSEPALSNGNTYPTIAVPWGMNLWTPQTGRMGHGWAYTYDAQKIRGFKQTHQPSPWMNDYGQFSLMPVTGGMKFDQNERASWFSHKSETATPYYYKVYLADHDVTTELTPTERAAQFRFTFPKSDSSFIVVDPFDHGSYVKVIPEENKIMGYTTKHAHGPFENFKNYFVIYFDKQFDNVNTWEGSQLALGQPEMKGNHAGAIVGFKTTKGEIIHARIASSFISYEQAEINLASELKDGSFEVTKQKAKKLWNDKLGKIKVEGSLDQMRTFYSCLYRTLLFPNKLYEINNSGEIMHWSPYTGEILPGYMFAGTGFWDTFRALYPFLNLVYPSINQEMQAGLVNDYKEGGWLPEWSSPGYANVMVGNNSASVVADAYIKGLRGYDIETLYEALIHGANNAGPLTAVGRAGAEYYTDLGYVPYDVGINESAARSLEYAYDDFTIYQLAKALNKSEEEIKLYAERSQNYKKLFDPSTGLMRGKNEDGTFQSPFNPFKWGDAFTEGNSWHYSWSVFHDVQGLIELMGGKENFIAKLDSVFDLPPVFDESYYSRVIHEIREMQIADMGQYAHGNQPIQHMIYLYNYAGAPWKTQYWARETMNRMYQATPDGYCGDEDNGQTSAWYVFSSLGFYPVCPGVNEYVLGAPLFKKVTVELENGNTIGINAPKNSNDNKYVQSLQLNGVIHSANYIKHEVLMEGPELDFEMSSEPNKNKGTARDDFPYSLSNEK